MSAYEGYEHDYMGFVLEGEESRKNYKESQGQYIGILARRLKRWSNAATKDFKSEKMKRFVRKGIPHKLRAHVWLKMTGAHHMQKLHPKYYEENCNEDGLEPITIEQIDLDIPRTFADNRSFSEDSKELQRAALRRVLLAIATRNPAIGYCQGMSNIAAMMLLVVKDERKTFWLLHVVISQYLPGYHSNDPVPMYGVQADLNVLSQLLQSNSPEVDNLLKVQKLDTPMVCLEWFICLYLGILPTDTVLRIWDILFSEGRSILFRVALFLIKKGEVSLASCTAIHHIVLGFKELVRQPYVWYSHTFIENVLSNTDSLTNKEIIRMSKREQKRMLVNGGSTQ